MSKRYVPGPETLQPEKLLRQREDFDLPKKNEEEEEERNRTQFKRITFKTTRSWTMNTIHTDRVMNVNSKLRGELKNGIASIQISWKNVV